MKKSIVAVLGVSALGVGLYASQALADRVHCEAMTGSWYNQGINKGCYFSGVEGDYTWGYAYGRTLSGEIQPGLKGVMADLESTIEVPNGYYVFTKAMGYTTGGGVIPGCGAIDTSAVHGQSAVDADGGCENGAKHRFYTRLDPIPM